MPGDISDTIFARIVRREVPARIIYQDEDVTAFHDIGPVAPTHVLVIPNKMIRTLNDATDDDERLLGKMLLTAQRIARELGEADSGYRIVINCNQQGGQSVYYLHFHLIAGRRMTWPPG
jgi:histidine triad (HIT) family protein